MADNSASAMPDSEPRDTDSVVGDLNEVAMLDDLQEMGFGDRSLNKKLMIKHDGSLKRTVKDLVTDGA